MCTARPPGLPALRLACCETTFGAPQRSLTTHVMLRSARGSGESPGYTSLACAQGPNPGSQAQASTIERGGRPTPEGARATGQTRGRMAARCGLPTGTSGVQKRWPSHAQKHASALAYMISSLLAGFLQRLYTHRCSPQPALEGGHPHARGTADGAPSASVPPMCQRVADCPGSSLVHMHAYHAAPLPCCIFLPGQLQRLATPTGSAVLCGEQLWGGPPPAP